jgi:hypothetical protein
MSDERWITVTEAADILRMTARQVNRYGNPPNARLRTKRSGRRVLYLMSDVTALADDLRVDIRPQVSQHPLAAPVSELSNRLRDLADAQRRVEEAIERIEQSGARQLPGPQGATKEELRDLLREVIAEQEATRRKEQEALRSRETRNWSAVIVIMLIALAIIVYFVLTR